MQSLQIRQRTLSGFREKRTSISQNQEPSLHKIQEPLCIHTPRRIGWCSCVIPHPAQLLLDRGLGSLAAQLDEDVLVSAVDGRGRTGPRRWSGMRPLVDRGRAAALAGLAGTHGWPWTERPSGEKWSGGGGDGDWRKRNGGTGIDRLYKE